MSLFEQVEKGLVRDGIYSDFIPVVLKELRSANDADGVDVLVEAELWSMTLVVDNRVS